MIPGIVAGQARSGRAKENLTTYTEVDTSSRLTVTSSRSTFSNLDRNVTAYLYNDFGAGYFSADISVDFDFTITASNPSGYVEVLGVNNQIGDANSRTDALSCSVFNNSGTLQLRIVEADGGTTHVSATNISQGTPYYCRLTRDESVGTYGTATLYVALSAANRSSGVWSATLPITLHSSKKDFRYLYPTAGLNTALAGSLVSGYVENVLINAP